MNTMYTPYLIFYKDKRNYVWNRSYKPDASVQYTITDDINQAMLYETREAAMKAMKKHLHPLCPKKLIDKQGIMIAHKTHLGWKFTEETENVRLDVILFDVTVVHKKIKKTKSISDQQESELTREWYIQELIKYTIYDEEWLRKRKLDELRWLRDNYWKRHFAEDPTHPEDKKDGVNA